jgi:hypothetical protein
MALARPPPPKDVVNQGSQALMATPTADNTTNQPGRGPAMVRP